MYEYLPLINFYVPGSAWLNPFTVRDLRYRWWLNYVAAVDSHIEQLKEANKRGVQH